MSRVIRSDAEWRLLRVRGQILPVITTVLGSATVLLPVIASVPLMPPLGLMMLLAWRLLRPELWPIWMGLPLGLVDDLFSGQPIGSAPLLWTLILLALDQLDRQNLFRDHWQDWMIAALGISFALIGGLWVANFAGGGAAEPQLIVPQIIVSVALAPVIMRLVAALDRWRLR